MPGSAVGSFDERFAHPLMSLVTASRRAIVCSAVDTVGVGREAHGDATSRRGRHIDGVVSHPGAGDDGSAAWSITAPSQRRLQAITAVGAGQVDVGRPDHHRSSVNELGLTVGTRTIEEKRGPRGLIRHGQQCTTSAAPPVNPSAERQPAIDDGVGDLGARRGR